MNQIIYVGKHLITYTVSRHAHPSWELIYCTGGGGVLKTDHQSLRYGTGDILVIPPNIPHTNCSEEGFTNLHIHMADPALNITSPTVIPDDGNEFVYNAFSAAFFHFSKPENNLAFLSAYGDLICYYISARQVQPDHSGAVEEIINCIIRNYPDSNFELDQYLRSFPFSYDYLRKLFKKETGMTPHQFLTNKRLEIAASCLSSELNDRSVTEIAHLCGYREPLYFSRIFKKAYGVSPSSYEAHIRASAQTRPDPESVRIRLD